jgi:hypothetical protein
MSKLRYLLLILSLSIPFASVAQKAIKSAEAMRTSTPPKIDGLLNDTVWQKAEIIDGLRQYLPYWDSIASQKTEIRILYDDNAIYVGAMMFDTHPDSILRQLGNRDDDNLNADAFAIEIDTYNDQNDAYGFQVWASGVQMDLRHNDMTYDAVWQSAVKILNNGWSVELKIPYSAIRFSINNVQTWGLEISRYIRRYREYDSWSMPEKNVTNVKVFWGKLNGISNIKAPLRLSFTPYISLYTEHYPYNVEGKSNYSESFSGGLDLKYGINESYTLDMTLLPDFSQVQSDNQVKNLTAFETVYDEQRPFFNEAVDLFQRGGIFYSRRIGHRPLLYDNVESLLLPGETIEKNPEQSKLVNATKLSGRNKNGLATGIFNAITDNMYAELKDSLGNKRRVLTDPLTNYNIVVFDQTLKNNSSVYIVNTNVIRGKGYRDANVTGAGFTLIDKTSTWRLMSINSLSQIYDKTDTLDGHFTNTLGYNYALGFAKIKGKFNFGIEHYAMNDTWDNNDLGLTLFNNYQGSFLGLAYNIYEPFWKFLEMENNLSLRYKTNFTTGKPIETSYDFRHVGTTQKHFTYWVGANGMFQKAYDYYEPRIPGWYYIVPADQGGYVGMSTDYRKAFALDAQASLYSGKEHAYTESDFMIRPLLRVSDKFSLNHKIELSVINNDYGFAAIDTSNSIVFGRRDRMTVTNTFTGSYIFKNDLSLSLRLRHYWAKGEYDKYYTLGNDGKLYDNSTYSANNNFNFNSFNIDLVFNWQFAPGSAMSLVWKNAILHEDQVIINNFIDNFSKTFDAPQTNSLSLKILYYLDYQYLKRKG